VTLQTVADQVGVSRMTVSNAFSKPDQLSAELRGRILAVADELGYAGPDPAARALARGTTGAIGVLLTDDLQYAFTDEVAGLFFGAIARDLAPDGLAITLLSSSSRSGHLPARDVPMDGALVYSCDNSSNSVDWLQRRKLPLVYVDQTPVPGISSVNVADREGARAAAQHIVDLGHRRVGIITSNFTGTIGFIDPTVEIGASHVGRQRMSGWLDALGGAGITPMVVQQRFSGEETGRQGAELMLDLAKPPTAILCFSDAMAYGVVQVASERGIDVPRDLSVVGFDDNPLAARSRPALTTVRQDVTAKGRAAAGELRAVLERTRSGGASRAKRIVLPTELVIRESTARPRAR
jgi:DNA-binding LacI/PurR family transcriptional regulator